MELTLNINLENTNAKAFLEFVKSLDFVKVINTKKVQTSLKNSKTLASSETEEEDENDISLSDKDFIMTLSQKTNKAIVEK